MWLRAAEICRWPAIFMPRSSAVSCLFLSRHVEGTVACGVRYFGGGYRRMKPRISCCSFSASLMRSSISRRRSRSSFMSAWS